MCTFPKDSLLIVIGGMGMSESGAGTDVLGMSTNAVLSSDGSHFILNGSKMWITNGTLSGSQNRKS